MSYVDLERHPVEQAPFVFQGVPFDDVNPEEDEHPLWSQVCGAHFNEHKAVLQPVLVGPAAGSICGVYGCENPANSIVLFEE